MVLQPTWASLFFSRAHLRLMLRSAILWGLGDVGAQAVTHYSAAQPKDKDDESTSFGKNNEEFKIDWYRVYNTSFVFGFGSYIGPAEYYWFSKRLRSSSTAEAVVSAVVAGPFATVNVATFFPLMGLVHGRKDYSVEQAKQDMKRGLTPALVLGGAVLPLALFANWRFIPVPYQLHCASLFGLVGSGALSWIELQQQRVRKMEVVQKSTV